MNLHAMLLERQAAGRPVTVGLIGAGKFGTMFLAQARSIIEERLGFWVTVAGVVLIAGIVAALYLF